MRKTLVVLAVCAVFTGHVAYGEAGNKTYTLSEVVEYALRNNARLAALHKAIEIETYTVGEAKGARFPRVDLTGSAVGSRYDRPVSPISGLPLEGGFPEFDNPTYEVEVSFNLPIYTGGRLRRQVRIAEIGRSIAEDAFARGRQELVFNVTSIYYKILELEKILEASEKRVEQLEIHKKNVELFLKAGNVPRIDLLNTESELARARHNALLVKHNIESAYGLLKTLMGMEDVDAEISLDREITDEAYPDIYEGVEEAFSMRPDYRAVMKRRKMADERVGLMAGKRLPALNLYAEYTETSGNDFDFRDNWLISLKLTVPLFDGGVIKTRIQRERKKLEKIKEEERALRLEILRQIKDAYLGIENARKRMEALTRAIETAEEVLRIERLKYEAGTGTSADVIDAQTALLRARVDYYRGVYDKHIAVAALEKAIGRGIYKEVSE